MLKLVSRKEWGARAPRAAASYLASTHGVKVHYTGGAETPRTHVQCAARVRGIQNGHMDGNGWNDVGYSFLVCQHGYVFVGRGLHHLPAANGPGLNTGHYAVCGLVGNKGVVEPTAAMLGGIRDAIEHCRSSGGAGNEIKGHRDGYSTDCPGGPLYAWVRKGAPRPGPTLPPKPPAPTPMEDDMPNGLLAEGAQAITPIALPKGRYKTIGFIADNGLQGLPPAKLRVAVYHGGGAWRVDTVTVDSAKGQTVVTFTDPADTSGISVRREDAGDVHVAFEVS